MHRQFARDYDSLTAIYEFAEEILAANEIGEAVRFPVHLAMEELFTNMVKYSPDTDSEIGVDIVVDGRAVTVTLTEDDVDEFDVTQAPDVDIGAPLAERTPGGLGLHLLQNIVDELEYDYHNRRSRVIFTKESG
ncbi:MAG: ATP-binding protein [Gammaproteobacteria bacterium]|nr:ATP-binding protein [Gammaproteobacteria bacterium]